MDDGPRRRAPNIADVARLAGVSGMTVSRVLNDHQRVRPETRSRVLAAMTSLGYRPNTAARTLVTGKSRVLGVVSFDTTFYGPASTLFGIEQAARSAGYFLSVTTLRSTNRWSAGEVMEHLRAQAVDGIIITAPHAWTARALGHVPPGIPVIAIEAEDEPVPTVASDQYVGAVKATRHLLSLGHEIVWHVGGPTGWPSARARERGWQDVLRSAGRWPGPVVLRGDWSPRSGYEQGRRLARSGGHVTAVFVANDQMALGVLRALREGGIEVPEGMSVVGFDDVPESAYFWPPLTTVRQDFDEIGRRSIELLLQRMEGAAGNAEHVLVEPELIVRQSTCPPRPERGGGARSEE